MRDKVYLHNVTAKCTKGKGLLRPPDMNQNQVTHA